MLSPGKLYGGSFNADDRNNPRAIIGRWTPDNARVLEVGPGDGVISRWLKEIKNCRTMGIELAPEAAIVAQTAFDRLIIGSIEDDEIIAQVGMAGPFDAIIFADVLEHLVDPWSVLKKMRPLLSPSGCVLLSAPNIAHWTARLNLLLGRFDYTNGYLMDRSHLRWFTRRSLHQMAFNAGYTIANESVVYKPRFIRIWPTFNGFQFVLRLMAAL